MILEIRLSNFFSIKEEITIDFRAANLKFHKEDSLPENLIQEGQFNALKLIALYGANASGKSNVIKSIVYCCRFILNSHNHNENSVFNFKKFKFEGYREKPSSFFIRFLIDGIEYEYSFSLSDKEVLSESLIYYPERRPATIFERNESAGKEKKERYRFPNKINYRPFDVADNTSRKTLYLSRASQMDREYAKKIFNYFDENTLWDFLEFDNNKLEHFFNQYKNILLNALKIADSDISDIQIEKLPGKTQSVFFQFSESGLKPGVKSEEDAEIHRIISYHKSAPGIPFDFNTEESLGTKKLFLLMLTVIDVVRNGKFLLIDEIENSLHPDIINYILEIFRASDKAQMLFSTHHTKILDLEKIRKDQIYFVNKNDEASSDLFSLYDFSDFRTNMNLEKAYLNGRFDAVPDIDYSYSELREMIHGE